MNRNDLDLLCRMLQRLLQPGFSTQRYDDHVVVLGPTGQVVSRFSHSSRKEDEHLHH